MEVKSTIETIIRHEIIKFEIYSMVGMKVNLEDIGEKKTAEESIGMYIEGVQPLNFLLDTM